MTTTPSVPTPAPVPTPSMSVPTFKSEPEDLRTHIQKMAEFSMTLGSEDQELLARELKCLGADFQ